jgi:cell division protein ZapA (FtsZ GTPase activity inhibitor)
MSDAPPPAVRVMVGGEELTVRSELPPEYTRDVAAHFDEHLRHIRSRMPTLELYKAAIMAGLAVTDELFRARRTDADVAERIAALTEDMARLLPPAKRAPRTGGTD